LCNSLLKVARSTNVATLNDTKSPHRIDTAAARKRQQCREGEVCVSSRGIGPTVAGVLKTEWSRRIGLVMSNGNWRTGTGFVVWENEGKAT
jgi:hypothetical protein